MILGITFDQWLIFAVLAFILIALYFELIGVSFTFVIAVAIFGVFHIVSPSEILAGFANPNVAVIILLLLIGDILQKTGVLEQLFNWVFKKVKTLKGFTVLMFPVVSVLSAFLNNTPLVAVSMPYVTSWGKRNNIAVSKLLIPLSYAAIIGGCATLIGTSTNLIVNGLVAEQHIIPDMPTLALFDFAWVGVPMIIVGALYMVFFGTRILPSKQAAIEHFTSGQREYLVHAFIRNDSNLIGKTILEAGLRDLKGLYLAEIIRGEDEVPAVSHDTVLEKGDMLVFSGDTENILEFFNTQKGLSLAEAGMMLKKKRTEIVEIVISHNSSLISSSPKEINFRAQYDAAVLSVYRNGERINGKMGNVVLKAGDALLIYAGEDFISRTKNSQDFYFISKVRDYEYIERYKTITLITGLILAITLSALNFISLFMALILLVIVCLFLGLTSPKELPKSIDYNLALIIVMSLALGIGIQKTGAADLIAHSFINLFRPFGPTGILLGVYIITTVLAAYITNKASVAIMFPIALTIALQLNLDPKPFVLVVAYSSAANFMTPVGYQTNLMVYGPGKYSFTDFFKVGFPLTVLYMVVAVTILSWMYF